MQKKPHLIRLYKSNDDSVHGCFVLCVLGPCLCYSSKCLVFAIILLMKSWLRHINYVLVVVWLLVWVRHPQYSVSLLRSAIGWSVIMVSIGNCALDLSSNSLKLESSLSL